VLTKDRRGKSRIQMETRRCLLRPFIAEDVEWLTDLIADPEVNYFIDDGVDSPVQARRFAEAIIDLDLNRRRFGYWAILDKETGAIHGWPALDKLRPWWGPSDEIAISYVLRRASWGQGLATEAAGQFVRRAFEDQWLDRIMAVIAVGNTASRRVLEKIGMRPWKARTRLAPKRFRYFRIDAPYALPQKGR
jgi:RimJ/RimL family protein N-acetyltransferase